MSFMDIIRRGGRSLRNAKLRTLLTASALAVGGFTLTLTLAASNGAKDYTGRLVSTNFNPHSLIVSKDDNLLKNGGNADDSPRPYDDSLAALGSEGTLVKELDHADLGALAKIRGVDQVIVYYPTTAQYATMQNGKKYTARTKLYSTDTSHQFKAGAVPNTLKQGDAVLPVDYVSLFGFKSAQAVLGRQLTLTYRQATGGTKSYNFNVVAVAGKPSTLAVNTGSDDILLSAADARATYGFINKGTVNDQKYITATVLVKNADEPALQAVKQRIKRAGYDALTAKDTQTLINQVVNVLQGIVLGFGAIALIASFFGVVNTQYISVLERTREIGLMKALGMSRRTVLALFVMEATWIGFIGAVLGSAVAVGLGTVLNPWISKKLSFGDQHLLVFHWQQILALVLFLMLVTTIAGLLPARKASKLDPIDALRTE